MVDHGLYASHTRLNARGLFNWRNYGKLPTAEVFEVDGRIVKVFVWTGLFEIVKGREVFTEGTEGRAGKDVLRISEGAIDFWNRVRMRWLATKIWAPLQFELATSKGLDAHVEHA